MALVAAFVAWQLDLFAIVDDKGDCAETVAIFGHDPKHAAAVCLRQANEGNAIAQTDIGKMYAEGRGVSQDFDQAKMWFEKAVLQKQPDALYNLGLLYANGDGVEQDWTEAVRWYRPAAELGQADAENSLGLRYEKGQGIDKDLVQAYKWFVLSLRSHRPAGGSRHGDRQPRPCRQTDDAGTDRRGPESDQGLEASLALKFGALTRPFRGCGASRPR